MSRTIRRHQRHLIHTHITSRIGKDGLPMGYHLGYFGYIPDERTLEEYIQDARRSLHQDGRHGWNVPHSYRRNCNKRVVRQNQKKLHHALRKGDEALEELVLVPHMKDAGWSYF